jgi:hypothetical protein
VSPLKILFLNDYQLLNLNVLQNCYLIDKLSLYFAFLNVQLFLFLFPWSVLYKGYVNSTRIFILCKYERKNAIGKRRNPQWSQRWPIVDNSEFVIYVQVIKVLWLCLIVLNVLLLQLITDTMYITLLVNTYVFFFIGYKSMKKKRQIIVNP